MKPNIPLNENNRWQRDKLLELLHNYWFKKPQQLCKQNTNRNFNSQEVVVII